MYWLRPVLGQVLAYMGSIQTQLNNNYTVNISTKPNLKVKRINLDYQVGFGSGQRDECYELVLVGDVVGWIANLDSTQIQTIT